LYNRIYVKQRMTAILFSKEEESYQATSNLLNQGSINPSNDASDEIEAGDDNNDDIWAVMEPIHDDHPKKKSKRI
jgi:hypothetical protein